MWTGLGLLLALCVLSRGRAESQGKSTRCKEPPTWYIGEENPMLESRGKVTVVALLQASSFYIILYVSRMDDLHLKLENEGLVNISYMIVNHQGEYSQHKHNLLKQRVSEFIPVYKQDMEKPNVWNLLNGNKDDFLIYDRCGRLVYHLGLPYSVLHFPYMEEAIRIAFCETRCGNCSFTVKDINEICNRTENTDEPVEEPPPTSVPDPPQQNPQHHGAHRHHRQHGHQ
uniref:Selenoprotein P n=1 Tax=Latimeria chalumnae TaxID=7897 RepID=H2ZVW4_LATCH